MTARSLKTPEIIAALADKYKAPEYALLTEVRNRTGYGGQVRSADAMAMSLYPSRGLELHGFEVKASRADWTKELSQPDKAEAICQFCDRWWIVVGDAAIIKPGELPPTWGLLVPRGDKLVVQVEAPKLVAQPFTRAFLAGLMRNLSESSVSREELGAMYDRGVKAGYRAAEQKCADEVDRAKRSVKQATEHYNGLQKRVSDFERDSGLQITHWQYGNVGPAVRALINGDLTKIKQDLAGVLISAEGVVRAIKHASCDIETAEPIVASLQKVHRQ